MGNQRTFPSLGRSGSDISLGVLPANRQCEIGRKGILTSACCFGTAASTHCVVVTSSRDRVRWGESIRLVVKFRPSSSRSEEADQPIHPRTSPPLWLSHSDPSEITLISLTSLLRFKSELFRFFVPRCESGAGCCCCSTTTTGGCLVASHEISTLAKAGMRKFSYSSRLARLSRSSSEMYAFTAL